MASWRFFAFLLLVSSQVFVGFSQDLNELLEGSGPIMENLGGQLTPCMQKMLPCQPFIKLPENPPPVCCTPLKELLTSDLPCVCSYFTNQQMLKAMNVSQSRALELPKACGGDLDIAACSNAEADSPAGSTDASPASSPPAPNTTAASPGDDSPSKSNSATRNNPIYGIGSGVAAASSFAALLLSAF